MRAESPARLHAENHARREDPDGLALVVKQPGDDDLPRRHFECAGMFELGLATSTSI